MGVRGEALVGYLHSRRASLQYTAEQLCWQLMSCTNWNFSLYPLLGQQLV